MKIGIITHYHESVNYGGVLQAYALAEYLNEKNVDAEQICYKLSNEESHKPTLSLKKKLRNIVISIHNNRLKKRFSSFKEFRQSVPHSAKIYSSVNCNSLYNDYDIIIAGSDQIWNFSWFDKNFFLDNPDERICRIAYAASFGSNTINDEQKTYLKKVLPYFKAISVREYDAVNIVKPIFDSVIMTCDPVFLLDAEKWKKLANNCVAFKYKYIYCHFIGNDSAARKIVTDFAEKKNLKVISIPHPSHINSHDFFTGFKKIDNAGPEMFLNLIMNAEYVFTDSFHCAAFSYIFNKQIFAFQRFKNGKMSSRMFSLFRIMNSTDHFITKISNNTVENIYNTDLINYENANRNIAEIIKDSKRFLDNAIKSNSY